MAIYKSNSQLSKATPATPPAKPVVSSVTRKKPSEFKRFLDLFLAVDPKQLKEDAVNLVVVPSIKQIVLDIISIALVGESNSRSSGSSRRAVNANKYDYGRCYNNSNDRSSDRPARRHLSYTEIYLNSPKDAETVIRELQSIIDEYECVTVGRFLECVNERASTPDYAYGWTNLDDVTYHHERDGWVIDFPKAKPLSK